jgi:hypothetical protein
VTYLEIAAEQIPCRVTAELLWRHRLPSVAKFYGWNFIDIIDNAYPNKFHPLDFKQVPNGYWQGKEGRERAIRSVRYLIETKCHIAFDEIPMEINHQFIKKHRLFGILRLFGDSLFKVVDAVYPGQFQPWQFSSVPKSYWEVPEHIKQTMEYFLFEKLGFSGYHDASEKLQKQHFFQYRLTGLLRMAFDNRLSHAKQWIVEQMSQYRTQRESD